MKAMFIKPIHYFCIAMLICVCGNANEKTVQAATDSTYVDAGMIKLLFHPEYPYPAIGLEGYCAGGGGKYTACANYNWDLGDGRGYSRLQNPSHTYNAAGKYNISLTATDKDGITSKAEVIVGMFNTFSYVLTRTQSKLNLAVDGRGFFQLRLPSGDIGYTRDGTFMIDRDGNIVNYNGYYIEPRISAPLDATDIRFEESGAVMAGLPGKSDYQEIGMIQLAQFMNSDGLESIGNKIFLEMAASGVPVIGQPSLEGFGVIRQFFLEVFASSQNRLDLSIDGEGYFSVRLPDGKFAYTRNGLFGFNQYGELVSAGGYYIEPPITIPPGTADVIVDKTGVISVKLPGEINPQEVGQIQLARFPNPDKLKSMENGIFIGTAASGTPITGQPLFESFGAIRQHFITQ